MVVSVLAASLTPPLLRVLADGYHLLVELTDMGPAFQFRLLYWKKGQESRVSLTLRFWAITESARRECTQALPRGCLSVPAPAVGLKVLPGVGLHLPVGRCGFLVEKLVCSFHISLSGKRNPLMYLNYR